MTQAQLEHATSYLEKLKPEYSLRLWLSKNSLLYFRIIPILLCMLIILFPHQSCSSLFIILNILYLVAQIFKLTLVILGRNNQQHNPEPINNLPIYTILLPVYREGKVIKRLITAISKLDYPKHLLDIKLLVEEDDTEVITAIESIILPQYFEVIKIPNSTPKTKPKACNYGLLLAKGKYIVVYDAEDHPHPQQLKQVVARFSTCALNVICFQAKLNYYNRSHNYLTQLFAIEYSLLFDYILTGLIKLKMPIPLGGTSNHFITEKLNELGGWDAYNVTEDADLGIRLYSQGYAAELIDSITLEESPISIKAWLLQRSRWIKGHILTSFLHLSNLKKMNKLSVFGVFFYLYIPNLTYILLPVYLLLQYFIPSSIKFEFLFHINIALGLSLPIVYSLFITYKNSWRDMKYSILISPFYYLLFPIAAIRSCWQIFTSPFAWNKTEHGLMKHEYDECSF